MKTVIRALVLGIAVVIAAPMSRAEVSPELDLSSASLRMDTLSSSTAGFGLAMGVLSLEGSYPSTCGKFTGPQQFDCNINNIGCFRKELRKQAELAVAILHTLTRPEIRNGNASLREQASGIRVRLVSALSVLNSIGQRVPSKTQKAVPRNGINCSLEVAPR